MRAMGLPERFASSYSTGEGNGRIGEVIERKDQRRSRVSTGGELEQRPAEQEADRQTARIAEKQLRHRPVERGEAQNRAEKRCSDQSGKCSYNAEETEKD